MYQIQKLTKKLNPGRIQYLQKLYNPLLQTAHFPYIRYQAKTFPIPTAGQPRNSVTPIPAYLTLQLSHQETEVFFASSAVSLRIFSMVSANTGQLLITCYQRPTRWQHISTKNSPISAWWQRRSSYLKFATLLST